MKRRQRRSFDEKTAKQLHRNAKISADRLGFREESDDLAQEVICHFLEGRGKGQTCVQSVIDIVRKWYGNKKSKTWKDRYALTMAATLKPNKIAIAQLQGRYDNWNQIVSHLKGEERCVIILFYVWELTLKEIGYVLNVSDSRVCQIKTKAEEFLAKKVKKT